ncbi:hypothetical protein [Nocardia goodfellowii]|uniref:Prevent-host-death protein n=1 Tax=Nocardia goodfellowii TaxID=882446 RepID=A0ABS4QC21_9NOCA|nr:hypothetical protein [Nocardia goodfellowii]MBP2189243.1 hypothetical protein [Nocardia goodfellowii]
MGPLRIPVSTASLKGVGWLVDASKRQRVILTSEGRPVAVVDACGRAPQAFPAVDLARACARLGVDEARVRERIQRLASR